MPFHRQGKGQKMLVVQLPTWKGGAQMIFDERFPGRVAFRVADGSGSENGVSERDLDLETILLIAPRLMKAAMLGLESVSFAGGGEE